jgi:putative addiction module component (TIGR02574 family)
MRGFAMNTKLLELSIDERIKLVEDLWDSIAAEQEMLRLTDEQRAELDQRLDAYEADSNRGRLATDAIAEIRSKL